MIIIFNKPTKHVLIKGEASDLEETIQADYSASPAGEGELPEREEQSAAHVTKGKAVYV